MPCTADSAFDESFGHWPRHSSHWVPPSNEDQLAAGLEWLLTRRGGGPAAAPRQHSEQSGVRRSPRTRECTAEMGNITDSVPEQLDRGPCARGSSDRGDAGSNRRALASHIDLRHPCVTYDAIDWLSAREAEDVTGARGRFPHPDLDPIPLQAMIDVTRQLNLNNNLAQSEDHDWMLNTIECLHSAGSLPSSTSLKAWARGHHWAHRGALRLSQIADRVRSGRPPRYKDQFNKRHAGLCSESIAYWSERASTPTT